jgi:regulatory protein
MDSQEKSETNPPAPARARTRRRGPKRATAAYLERAALFYLERYASSAANLRRILLRKVARSAAAHETDPEEGAAAVEVLIARFLDSGLLDDAAYARGRVLSLHRRGASARAIRARLSAKGVAAEEVESALAALHDMEADPELAAALAFARRRRLGPFRKAEVRAQHRQRDLAALGRQGFAYGLARRVIEAEDPEALRAEAGSD